MKIRENTKFPFPLHDVLIVVGGIKWNKASVGPLAEPWGVLARKSAISLSCPICELRHFHLNQDEEW